MDQEKLICVGQILGAHGVEGVLKIRPFTEKAENLKNYKPLLDHTGQKKFSFSFLSLHKGNWLAKLKGIKNREEAAVLKGEKLFVTRDQLKNLKKDEYYHEDLIGSRVKEKEDGLDKGTIIAVHNFGASDILEIKTPDEKNILVPFIKDSIKAVNIEKGYVIIEKEFLLDS